ncbi:MAG: DUF1573 domain-containing protein [Bacteroidetes bacterium]|nr:DUF1573 domain-containing protein [Bacteroidota bacterium]
MKNILCSVIVLLSFVAGFAQTPPTLNDQYAKRIGSLRFTKSTLSFGRVKNNEVKTDTLRMFNSGMTPITVSVQNKLSHLQISPAQLTVEVGKEGVLVITYDVAKRNDFGFVLDRISLNTNDNQQPVKPINITATIDEFFASPADSLSPKARVIESSYNYGTIHAGEKASHEFVIFNDGQKPLLVHKTKSTCGCIKSSATKTEILPGQSGTIKIEFDSFGKDGKDSRITSVYINDPLMPEIKLEMTGTVLK